ALQFAVFVDDEGEASATFLEELELPKDRRAAGHEIGLGELLAQVLGLDGVALQQREAAAHVQDAHDAIDLAFVDRQLVVEAGRDLVAPGGLAASEVERLDAL